MKEINPFIGNKIREMRESAGLTQSELAKKMGMKSHVTLSFLENGKNLVSEKMLIKILSQGFDMSIQEAKEEASSLRKMEAISKFGLVNSVSENDFISVPFLGEISCGDLTENIPDTDEYRQISKKYIQEGKKYAVLVANGMSMIDAGIQEGDEVLVCTNCEPIQGDICVFELRGEMTMGYLYKDERFIEIKKANRSYAPIPIDDEDFRVAGVVISFTRSIKKKEL